jgi:4-hydroxybenzoate polyprenyltransferase
MHHTLYYLLKTMRPYQWYKNCVVFAGLIFGGVLFHLPSFLISCAACGIFCLLSGAGYLLNDVADYHQDILHPEKRKRPVASGLLSRDSSLIASGILFTGGLLAATFITQEFTVCATAYVVLTIVYSLQLKHYIFVDVLTISTLFVIRAAAGAYAIAVFLSPWLILCAFMLALFLAFCKRTQEKSPLYPSSLLHTLLNSTTALLLMSYCLYTFLRAHQHMMFTIPIVFYGIFTFLAISCDGEQRSVESMMYSARLVMTFLVWIIMSVLIIYVWE